MRPQEPRSFATLKEVSLEDPDEARFWIEHLKASPEEIEAAIEKVGGNRTALELYLGITGESPSAGPSLPEGQGRP